MISCPSCGTLNRKGSKYCSNCGQRLDVISSVICPSCGGPNLAGSVSCSFCGEPLPSAVTEEKGEVVQPEPVSANEPSESEPAAMRRSKLPSWLRPRSAKRSEALASSTVGDMTVSSDAASDQEGCRYLQGIHGVLPSADAWLSPSQDIAQRPVSESTTEAKPGARWGCLLLGALLLTILVVVLLLALMILSR